MQAVNTAEAAFRIESEEANIQDAENASDLESIMGALRRQIAKEFRKGELRESPPGEETLSPKSKPGPGGYSQFKKAGAAAGGRGLALTTGPRLRAPSLDTQEGSLRSSPKAANLGQMAKLRRDSRQSKSSSSASNLNASHHNEASKNDMSKTSSQDRTDNEDQNGQMTFNEKKYSVIDQLETNPYRLKILSDKKL